MASPDERRPRELIRFLGTFALLLVLGALGLVVLQAIRLLSKWDFGIADTPPRFSSSGPTIVQLERLQYLVSTRVHVADVLVGESRWLEGSWIIQGDALLAVDMAKAEIKDRNEQAKTAVIVLPQPAVLSARVNHEKTQEWDIKSRSWIPLASSSWATGLPWRSRRCFRHSSSSSGRPVQTTTRRRPGRAWKACSPSSIKPWAGTSRSSGSDAPHGDAVRIVTSVTRSALIWQRRQCNRLSPLPFIVETVQAPTPA